MSSCFSSREASAPQDTLLGKTTVYLDRYQPQLLTPIPRILGRSVLTGPLTFLGTDIWRLYEVTWLDEHGLPQVATGEIWVPAVSPNIVESKSLKLYIVSLTQTVFKSLADVKATIVRDVSACVGAEVTVHLQTIDTWSQPAQNFPGLILETEDLKGRRFSDYEVNPDLLAFDKERQDVVSEVLVTHLMRSRCPVTGQPDFASVQIAYEGQAIDHGALLAYLVSFRQHQGFHEQCVERIFTDIQHRLSPRHLSVYGTFTRRGGIDISPWRSTESLLPCQITRASRQ